jgi:dihydrofolate reductase
VLLGRTTYEGFAAAWPNMVEETGPFGERMNGIQKYVVTSTLDRAEWTNSAVARDTGSGVTALRYQRADRPADRPAE